MFKLMFVVLMAGFSSAIASSTTVSVSGSGSAESFCSSSMGSFCLDGVKRDAETQAKENAETSCEEQRGTTGYLGCNTNCNPPFIPGFPDQPNQMVSCESTCSGSCFIQ